MRNIHLAILRAFLLNLSLEIQRTYLFSFRNVDLMDENDKIAHFNWCFDSTLNLYQENKIFIRKNEETLKTFYQVFKVSMYDKSNKKETLKTLQPTIKAEFKGRKKGVLTQLEEVLFQNMGI
jgi:hypothetical protein